MKQITFGILLWVFTIVLFVIVAKWQLSNKPIKTELSGQQSMLVEVQYGDITLEQGKRYVLIVKEVKE